jgi:uncharacterized protein (TIGR02391 family)
MKTLYAQIPDADVLLALPPEQLGKVLLRLAPGYVQNGMFHPQAFTQPPHGNSPWYPPFKRDEVDLAIREAWLWLQLNLLVVPAAGMNGSNGWFTLGRRARQLETDASFDAFTSALKFPRELVHSRIRDKVWLRFAEGDLAGAVLHAFHQVEVRVREAAQLADTDIGVNLMRKAFNEIDGPLADQGAPASERKALAELFAAAIGSYKNPHSHRDVDIRNPLEAQEMVILASHLLGIVDARQASRRAAASSPTQP